MSFGNIHSTGGFQPNIAGPADRGAGAEEHRVLQRARLRMDTLDLAGWGTERVERDRGSLERESAGYMYRTTWKMLMNRSTRPSQQLL